MVDGALLLDGHPPRACRQRARKRAGKFDARSAHRRARKRGRALRLCGRAAPQRLSSAHGTYLDDADEVRRCATTGCESGQRVAAAAEGVRRVVILAWPMGTQHKAQWPTVLARFHLIHVPNMDGARPARRSSHLNTHGQVLLAAARGPARARAARTLPWVPRGEHRHRGAARRGPFWQQLPQSASRHHTETLFAVGCGFATRCAPPAGCRTLAELRERSVGRP